MTTVLPTRLPTSLNDFTIRHQRCVPRVLNTNTIVSVFLGNVNPFIRNNFFIFCCAPSYLPNIPIGIILANLWYLIRLLYVNPDNSTDYFFTSKQKEPLPDRQ